MEKKKENLIGKIQSSFINPLFSKISGNYDEGGVKGLLFNSLETDFEMNYLLYNSTKNKERKFFKVLNTRVLEDVCEEVIFVKDGMKVKHVCPNLFFFRKNLQDENEDNQLDFNVVEKFDFKEALDDLTKEEMDFEKNILTQIDSTQMNFKISQNNSDSYIIENDTNFETNDENIFGDINEESSNSQDFTRKDENFQNDHKINNSEIQIDEEILFSNNFDFWDYIEPEKLLASLLKRKKKIKNKNKKD